MAEEENEFLESLFESLVRITLAGFGGNVVGLAYQHRQQLQQRQVTRPSMLSSAYKIPPQKSSPLVKLLPRTNLPSTWGLACTLFALILETSRRVSPTNIFLSTMEGYPTELPTAKNVQRTVLTTVGDYVVGGSVAGIAGAIAARRRTANIAFPLPPAVRSNSAFLFWGFGAGMALGLIAGVLDASVAVGNIYLEQEERRKYATNKSSKQSD